MDTLFLIEMKFLLMMISFIAWTVFYNAIRHNYPAKSARICNHYMTVFYSLLFIIFMYLSLGLENNSCVEHRRYAWNVINIFSLVLTWGYISFNLIWSIYHGDDDIVYVNQIISLVLILHYLFVKTSNPEVIIKGLGFLELSNPSSHAKWYLRNLRKKESFHYEVIVIVTLSTLAILRFLYGSYYLSAILFNCFYDTADKFIACYVYTIGLLLFYNIIPLWRSVLAPDKQMDLMRHKTESNKDAKNRKISM